MAKPRVKQRAGKRVYPPAESVPGEYACPCCHALHTGEVLGIPNGIAVTLAGQLGALVLGVKPRQDIMASATYSAAGEAFGVGGRRCLYCLTHCVLGSPHVSPPDPPPGPSEAT